MVRIAIYRRGGEGAIWLDVPEALEMVERCTSSEELERADWNNGGMKLFFKGLIEVGEFQVAVALSNRDGEKYPREST